SSRCDCLSFPPRPLMGARGERQKTPLPLKGARGARDTRLRLPERAPMAIGDYIRNTQVWKSIFRHPAPRDRRTRVVVMLTNVFLHLHPVSVRKSGIDLSYTWCMGGITFFLFLVETVTGVLLMFYYRPTLEHAYNDILSLRDVATLGILRELHRW